MPLAPIEQGSSREPDVADGGQEGPRGFIDVSGRIYRWTGTGRERAVRLKLKRRPNLGMRLICGECLLNAAANAAGDKLYVSSSRRPYRGTSHSAAHLGARLLVCDVEFALGPAGLSNARPVTAFENRSDGHLGGGLTVLDDGSVLTVMADNGDSYEDGRAHPQDLKVTLGKIDRVNVADGSSTIVASGIRGPQRLVISGQGAGARLTFIEPGGWVVEELNSVPLADFLGDKPLNFDGDGRRTASRVKARSTSIRPETRCRKSRHPSPGSSRLSPRLDARAKRGSPCRDRRSARSRSSGSRRSSAIW